MISRFLVYSGLFLFLFSLETGFLSAFPTPWSWIPVVPAFALWFLNQKGSRIGMWYLLGWGVGSDILHRNPWGPDTLVALGMVILWAAFASRLFTARSLYGFLAFIISQWLWWFLVEAIFRFFGTTSIERMFDGFISFSLFRGMELILLAASIFWVEIRLREAHLRL